MRALVGKLLLAGLIVLPSCATRPLQDHVTRFTLLEIAEKIKCEAADAVSDFHPDSPNLERSLQLKQLDKTIGDVTKELENARNELLLKGFGITQAQINESSDGLALQGIQVKEAGELWDSRPDSLTKKLRIEAIEGEVELLRKKRVALNAAIDDKKIVDKLTERLKTLREHRVRHYKDISSFESQTAALNFQFTITVNKDATSKGSLKWPIAILPWTGTAMIGYDVGDKKQRLSDRTIKLSTSFGELYQLDCGAAYEPGDSNALSRYPITGSIGLDEVIGSYIKILRKGNSFNSNDKESYKDKIEFTTTVNASINPSVTLTKLSGHEAKAEGSFGATRKDVHTVTIFLKSPGSGGSKSKPQSVAITSMPTLRVRAHVNRQPPYFFNNMVPTSSKVGN